MLYGQFLFQPTQHPISMIMMYVERSSYLVSKHLIDRFVLVEYSMIGPPVRI